MRNTIKQWIHIVMTTMILQMKQSFARPMFRFCLLVNPVVNTIFLYEMFLNSTEANFIQYVILGAGLMGIWGCICFSSAGDINRERYSGTLSIIYVAPGGFGTIIFGKVFGNTLISLLTFVIAYVTALCLSGQPIEFHHAASFLLALVLAIFCFMVVSLCIAYCLMLSRKTELYMNLIEIPFILVCGFVFPVEMLPGWLQKLSVMLPPTWAVRLLRMSLVESNKLVVGQYYLILMIELAVFIGITVILYRWMDKRVRIKATLEVS